MYAERAAENDVSEDSKVEIEIESGLLAARVLKSVVGGRRLARKMFFDAIVREVAPLFEEIQKAKREGTAWNGIDDYPSAPGRARQET